MEGPLLDDCGGLLFPWLMHKNLVFMFWQRIKLFFRNTKKYVLCNFSSHLGKCFPFSNQQSQHDYLIHSHHLCYLHFNKNSGELECLASLLKFQSYTGLSYAFLTSSFQGTRFLLRFGCMNLFCFHVFISCPNSRECLEKSSSEED